MLRIRKVAITVVALVALLCLSSGATASANESRPDGTSGYTSHGQHYEYAYGNLYIHFNHSDTATIGYFGAGGAGVYLAGLATYVNPVVAGAVVVAIGFIGVRDDQCLTLVDYHPGWNSLYRPITSYGFYLEGCRE